MDMITFKDVSFRYRGSKRKEALSGLNFHINKGETVLFCGGSGCGKSTITRIMNGLIPHFYKGDLTGTVTIDGEDLKGKTLYEINRNTGSVFQNPRTQFFNLDTDAELVFGGENRGMELEEIEENRDRAVTRFQMEDLLHRNIMELSGGQQQRVACASIYCTDPEIYVLDEPTSNLDEASIEALRETLEKLKAEGKTIIVAEHRLYFLKNLADRIFYLKNGRLEEVYTAEEFQKLSQDAIHAMGLRSLDQPKREPLGEKQGKTDGELTVKNLSVRYTDRVKGTKKEINLGNIRIPYGEVVAVIGKNGIGKSTFSRALAGLQKGCRAEILKEGKVFGKKDRIKNCYLVMQDVNHQLFCESVEKEITLGSRERDEARLAELLKRLDLQDLKDTHPMDLSGGQKQRVAIGAALYSGKRILILDEPTSGLDYGQMIRVAEALKEAKKDVDVILLITHDVELMNACCTAVLDLRK